MFKQISILLVLSSLTANVYASTVCGQDNAQICALQLSQEAFADMDCTDDPQVVDFTLTNNTPGPIAIESDIFDGNISGATVAITGGSCGNSAPPGKCSIEVTVTPDCDGITPGDSIAVDAVLNVDPDVNQGDLIGPIQLNITNSDLGFIALAAGYSNVSPDKNTGDSSYPYYVVYDAAGSWDTTTLSREGSLQTATCSGIGATATCFVAGSILPDTNAATTQAVAYVSTNGGVDWSETTANVNGTNVVDITCTDDANLCELIAENASLNSTGDVIYRTTDKGQTWTQKFADDESRLLSIDCDGSICAAGGFQTFEDSPNRLFIWDFGSSLTDTVPNGTNKATACSDSGTNKICFFGGYVEQEVSSLAELTTVPSLYYVKPGDANPTAVDLTQLVNSGSIDAIDCILIGGKVACAAGGDGTLYQNVDAFNNPTGWLSFNASAYIKDVKSISCASASGICLAAGQDINELATILSLGEVINAGQGIFNSISCTTTTVNNLNDDVSCIASGTKTESGAPLVWINKSVIATPGAWASAPVSLTTSGAMNATGAASGN